MFKIVHTYFLLLQYFILIKCEIPTLTVRRVDAQTIEKKRQDTLEICRLFNEENNIEAMENEYQPKRKRRIKRDVEETLRSKPLLNEEDAVRVEKIVDKLYDDLQEDGKKVTYRRRNLNSTTTKGRPGKSNRRFFFAPSVLLSPNQYDPHGNRARVPQSVDQPVEIPWVKKWKHGIIPYFIDPRTYGRHIYIKWKDSYLSDIIIKAFDYIEKATCIRLQRLRTKPQDEKSMQDVEWLYITNPSGVRQCVHSNERKPNLGVQIVVLGYDCLSQGEVAHEIMHVLGFSHEHTRPDRDQYITINWNNIKPGYKKYFSVQSENIFTHLSYDYASVLHYPPRAFSKNGQHTIIPSSGTKIGQREGFSVIDVEKIGIIFGIECIARNKDYLLKTCPKVVKGTTGNKPATTEEINQYFEDKIWPYGIINYKLKDNMEFTSEERQNIKAVIAHIEKETCIEFRDASDPIDVEEDTDSTEETMVTIYNSKKADDSETEDDQNLFANDTKQSTTSASKLTLAKKTKASDSIAESDNEVMSSEDVTDKNLRRHRAKTQQYTTIPIIQETKGKRRHASNVLVLTRSTEAGCPCPPAGRPDGNKEIQISRDCFNSVNDLLHFFVHILGLDHQHNMYDRDSFIQILWDRLTPDLKKEMENKLPPAASVGFAYDYQSVMHFPWLEIKDGVTNIMYPIWNDGWAMGHWQGLSIVDVKKLNRIYQSECSQRNQTSGVQ